MFNVSANEFAKMSVTAHAISRHFGFHWGRVDLLIDSTTGMVAAWLGLGFRVRLGVGVGVGVGVRLGGVSTY